jgi:DNA-binding NarL/FixJ family response regulator
VNLTPRETTLLRELCRDGAGNKEIAYRIGITESSVKVYLFHLCRKLSIAGRGALIIWAFRNRIEGEYEQVR